MGKTQDIREAVEAELSYDPLIDPADISVMNINGDVALNGTVPSYPQYLEAAAAAQRVTGVKNVHNHLEVVLSDDDYRDDAMLTTSANNALTVNITVLGVGAHPAVAGRAGGWAARVARRFRPGIDPDKVAATSRRLASLARSLLTGRAGWISFG
jgi:hypothetical protein